MEGYNFNGNLQIPMNIRDPYFMKQDQGLRGCQDGGYGQGIYFPSVNMHGNFQRPKRDPSHDHHFAGVKYMKVHNGSGVQMTMTENSEMPNSMDPELKYLLAPDIVKYSCPRCSEAFIDGASLDNHLVAIHGQVSCPVMRDSLRPAITQVTSLNSMQVSHHTMPVYQPSLPQVTPLSIPLSQPKEEPPTKPANAIACPKCFDLFPTTEALSKHSHETHGGKFRCTECPRAFHEQEKLSAHVSALHVTLKPFQCIECESKFSQKSALKEHVETEHRNQTPVCSQCDISFPNKAALKRHSKSEHVILPKAFDCLKCQKGFRTKRDLKLHMESSDECCEDLSFSKSSGKPVRTRPFKCSDCSMSFGRKRTLENHRDEVHADDENELIACSHCEFTSLDSEAVTSHILDKHLKIKPFACTECSNKFSTKGHLDQHKSKAHKYLRPYMCAICDKPFGKKYELTKHYFSKHESNKNPQVSKNKYSCSKCGKAFRMQRRLAAHVCSETTEPELSIGKAERAESELSIGKAERAESEPDVDEAREHHESDETISDQLPPSTEVQLPDEVSNTSETQNESDSLAESNVSENNVHPKSDIAHAELVKIFVCRN